MDFKAFLENINDDIKCAMCHETYGEPKKLPCIHTFCLNCLNSMADRAIQDNRAAIRCPLCNANIQIPHPDGNFNSLPNNIYINRLKDIVAVREARSQDVTCGNCEEKAKQASYCFECSRFCCTKCESVHQIVKEFKGHRVLALKEFQEEDLEALLRQPAFCQRQHHENEFVKYYCHDCSDCVCLMCVTVEHKTHRVQLMDEVASAYQADIAKQVAKAKEQLQEYVKGAEEVQERKALVERNLETVKTEIHNRTEALIEALRTKERELVAEVTLAATSQDHAGTQRKDRMQ